MFSSTVGVCVCDFVDMYRVAALFAYLSVLFLLIYSLVSCILSGVFDISAITLNTKPNPDNHRCCRAVGAVVGCCLGSVFSKQQ